MAEYRKKPVQNPEIIEAVQWDGTAKALGTILNLGIGSNHPICTPYPCRPTDSLEITTLEGVRKASPGDWIIKGVQGELYPCTPDIFEATYEPVE